MFTSECSIETTRALNPVEADSHYGWISVVIDSNICDRTESKFRVSGAIFTSRGIDAKSGMINVQIGQIAALQMGRKQAEDLK